MIKFEKENKLPVAVQEQLAADSDVNMEGVEPRLPKIIMPTGRGKDFAIENHGGDDIEIKEFTGIILFQSAANAYWIEPFGGGDAVVPDCASHDGIVPSSQYEHIQSKTCGTCKHNRFGSAVDDGGNKLPGKACRNVKRIVVLRTDDMEIPCLLTAPPSSIPNFNDYMVFLKKERRPYFSVATKFFIKTESNRKGIEYPQINFQVAGYINKEESLNKLKETRANWMDLIRSTMFASEDADPQNGTEPTVDPDKTEF